MEEPRAEDLFQRAAEALDNETEEAADGVAPEEFIERGRENGGIEIGGLVYPEPSCYAYILLERIAAGRLPYELGPTERGLYLLWTVLNQDSPAELAALSQRPLPESELVRFAAAHPPEELYRFVREYPPRALEVVRKKGSPAAPEEASG